MPRLTVKRFMGSQVPLNRGGENFVCLIGAYHPYIVVQPGLSPQVMG